VESVLWNQAEVFEDGASTGFGALRTRNDGVPEHVRRD
jgi:hypothetical protein